MSLGNIDIKTYHHNNRAPTSRIDHIMYLKGQEGYINKSMESVMESASEFTGIKSTSTSTRKERHTTYRLC